MARKGKESYMDVSKNVNYFKNADIENRKYVIL